MKEMLKKIWFGRSIRHSVLYALVLGLLFSVPRALFLGWSALFMALTAGIFFAAVNSCRQNAGIIYNQAVPGL